MFTFLDTQAVCGYTFYYWTGQEPVFCCLRKAFVTRYYELFEVVEACRLEFVR